MTFAYSSNEYLFYAIAISPHTVFPTQQGASANKETQNAQCLYFTPLSLKSSAFDHSCMLVDWCKVRVNVNDVSLLLLASLLWLASYSRWNPCYSQPLYFSKRPYFCEYTWFPTVSSAKFIYT
jgi:hypothetical protein